jgi:hypothetical protein
VNFWCRYARAQFRNRAGWELQNLLTVARLMIDTALRREESPAPLPHRLPRSRRHALARIAVPA